MPRLKLILAYVGTHYHGWQVQAWKDRPHPPTVQGELEKAVASILGTPTHVQGAGRTDSGVHAAWQVAHCDIPEQRVTLDWQRALHTRLPRDIRVVDARIVPDGFDACFSVSHKAYTYRLWLDERFTPPALQPFVWACGPLALDRLDAAIPHLLGEHDFRSLQNAGTDIKTTVRTIYDIKRSPCLAAGESRDTPTAAIRDSEAGENRGCALSSAEGHHAFQAPISPGSISQAPILGAGAGPVGAFGAGERHLDYGYGELFPQSHLVTLQFNANGFLKQMVRNTVGLLVACGRGKFDPDAVPELLLARDRRQAPVTAPPQGLILSRVWYKEPYGD